MASSTKSIAEEVERAERDGQTGELRGLGATIAGAIRRFARAAWMERKLAFSKPW